MTSNLPPRIARLFISMCFTMALVAPAARAQSAQGAQGRQTQPAAAVRTPQHATIKHVCYSTDPKGPVAYFSDIFDLVDRGSEADNFIGYERAKIRFQIYLLETYKYNPATEDAVDCRYSSSVTTANAANAAAAMAAKKQSLEAEAGAARKQVVETHWKWTEESGTSAAGTSAASPTGSQSATRAAAVVKSQTDPILTWEMKSEKDALSDEVTTKPTVMRIIPDANGKPQGFVTASAYCSTNGASVFFKVGAGDKDPLPSFSWYNDASRGDDQVADVRIRVDDRPVHVAQGFPEIDGHTSYTNTLGLLFYEPRTFDRAVRDQQDNVTTGLPALDGLLGGIVRQSAQVNAQAWQDSSPGPLSDLVNARSIRVELPVTTFSPKPVLDLNPQDPVLHKFVSDCNAKFTGARAPAAPAPATRTAPAPGNGGRSK
jgi:hypothetical protein